jgi:molybdopterin-guanine dinucleotide biosynthesis protein B
MPEKYVVRFISTRSGAGKTHIASFVVSSLVQKGYRVAVVKHCEGGIDLEDKDSKRYLESRAMSVTLVSEDLLVAYRRGSLRLEEVVARLNEPIVVVEGFKASRVGDAVFVVTEPSDVDELRKVAGDPIAIYARAPLDPSVLQAPIYRVGEEDRLVELIEKRALEHYYSQLPRLDCGLCRYSTCRGLLHAYLRGETLWCPVASEVSVIVDGVAIPLNPFVKNIIKSTVWGMLKALKGVSERPRRVELKIED